MWGGGAAAAIIPIFGIGRDGTTFVLHFARSSALAAAADNSATLGTDRAEGADLRRLRLPSDPGVVCGLWLNRVQPVCGRAGADGAATLGHT